MRLVGMLVLALSLAASSQGTTARERARPHALAAWKQMRAEAFPQAAVEFKQAIDIDPEFEDAYYGLGLAYVRMKQYAEAIPVYIKCRDLYEAQAGKQFTNRQEAQRYRQDRLTEIDEVIRSYQSGPQTMQSQEQLRRLEQQKREIQEYMTRGNNFSVETAVPAYVHLALGSAYFRTVQMTDAEREYKAAIAVDPKSGEAQNNLAVVYLQTGRYQEADDAVRAAEKAGYKVHPQLKQDIKAKLK